MTQFFRLGGRLPRAHPISADKFRVFARTIAISLRWHHVAPCPRCNMAGRQLGPTLSPRSEMPVGPVRPPGIPGHRIADEALVRKQSTITLNEPQLMGLMPISVYRCVVFQCASERNRYNQAEHMCVRVSSTATHAAPHARLQKASEKRGKRNTHIHAVDAADESSSAAIQTARNQCGHIRYSRRDVECARACVCLGTKTQSWSIQFGGGGGGSASSVTRATAQRPEVVLVTCAVSVPFVSVELYSPHIFAARAQAERQRHCGRGLNVFHFLRGRVKGACVP